MDSINIPTPTESPARLPNFFVMAPGSPPIAPLLDAIEQHPDVYLSPMRDSHYFAPDLDATNARPDLRRSWYWGQDTLDAYLDGPTLPRRPGRVFRWEQYVKLFKLVTTERAVGEASVYYLRSRVAPLEIRRVIPDARIVIVLREPVSHWVAAYVLGCRELGETRSFRDVVESALASNDHGFGRPLGTFDGAFYAEDVRRYLDTFPAEQVRVWLLEDFLASPALVTGEILEFLGVDPTRAGSPDVAEPLGPARAPRVHHLLRRAGLFAVARHLPRWLRRGASRWYYRAQPDIDVEVVRRLKTLYRSDVERLASLIGRDLSAWL